MLCKTFECAEHEDYGGLGWREKDKPHFGPLGGMAVAHDTLEHFPDDQDRIECECEALGAMVLVRSDRMNWHRFYQSVQSDCIDLYRLHSFESMPFSEPTAAMFKPTNNDDLEEELALFKKTTVRYLVENNHSGDNVTMEELRFIRRFVHWMAAWIRNGYRRARRRYRHYRLQSSLPWMSQLIAEAADKALKQAQAGDELKVMVSLRSCDVKVRYIDQYESRRSEPVYF